MSAPQQTLSPRRGASGKNLSTGTEPEPQQLVDKLPEAGLQERWLGCMVPKRHAKRAVTRNLIKRQMRAGFARHAEGLLPGLWLLRQHASFPVADYPSARSEALAEAARREIERLLGGAQR